MSTKLYVELAGVVISPDKIPKHLRSLTSIARQWCFIGETALASKLKKTPDSELSSVVAATEPRLAELQKYCFETDELVPVPHEAAMFQIFLTSYLELRSALWLRESSRKK
jgi:hypothetical protein